MLTNGTITRIDAAPMQGPDGSCAFIEGAATEVRCAIDQPRTGQKWIVGAAIREASAVIYIQGVAGPITVGGRVVVRVDGESADRLYEVLHLVSHSKGSLTHHEVYCR